METLKTAVIGVGNMGRHHARVYHELENSELVAVADVNTKQAREIAKKYSCNPYRDYKKMLEKEKPDCVSVVVPTSLHEKIGSVVLGHAHALVEKPIASTEKEAVRLIKKARKHDRKLMVGHIERFNPVVQYIKNKIPKKEFLSFAIMRLGPYIPQSRTTGVLADLGIHDIDTLRYLTREEPVYVYASVRHINITDHEDHAHLFLKFPSCDADVITNWISPRKIRQMHVVSRKKFIIADYIEQELLEYKKIGESITAKPRKIVLEKKEPLKQELASFLESVARDKPVECPGEDALESLRVTNRALKIAYTDDPNW